MSRSVVVADAGLNDRNALQATTALDPLETYISLHCGHREAWNKGKLVGQKPSLKPKEIWAIRIQLQNAHQVRDLAMFNLAIDSKLRPRHRARPHRPGDTG